MEEGGDAFIGREHELRLVLDRLLRPHARGAVVGGRAGVGKTHLARAAARRWTADGRPLEWISCTASASTIPFGATARFLGRVLPEDFDVHARASELVGKMVARLAETPGLLLVVDDAQLLDELSALVVHHLVLSDVVPVLATVRSGSDAPSSIEVLWRDGHVERVDLLPLGEGESATLAGALLGVTVTEKAARGVHRWSEGNPLLLRQLVEDARDAGAFVRTDRGWHWDGELRSAPRLEETVGARVDALPAADRSLLVALALAEPIGADVLREVVPDADLYGCARRDLVRIDQDGRRVDVGLGHPLFGELARRHASAETVRRLAAAVASSLQSRGARRRADLLVVGTLRLTSGATSDPDLLVDAARRALSLGDARLAARLASAAPGPVSARVLLGEALFGLFDLDAAITTLRAALDDAEDDVLLARIAYALHQAHFHRGDDISADDLLSPIAARVSDPVWRAVLDGQIAQDLCLRGHTKAGSRRAERLLETWGHEPRVRLRLLTAVTAGRLLAGRTMASLELTNACWGDAVALQAELPVGVGWVVGAQLQGLLMSGQLEAADNLLGALDGMAGLMMNRRPFLRLYRGRLALLQGAVRTAAANLSVASEGFGRADLGGFLRWSLSLEAEALALCGDIPGARRCHDAALAAPSPTKTYDGEARRSRAWVAACEGRLSAAIDDLLELAALQRVEDQLLPALFTLHDAFRLGARGEAATDIAELAGHVDGAWPGPIEAHVEARAADDPVALETAASRFADMGAHLHAAEIQAAAVSAFERARLVSRATRAKATLAELLARCESARSPVLVAAPSRTPLTRREQEVATLAARGLSTKAISTQLYISERTAEGHLYRAMTKLGVRLRSELGEILDQHSEETRT